MDPWHHRRIFRCDIRRQNLRVGSCVVQPFRRDGLNDGGRSATLLVIADQHHYHRDEEECRAQGLELPRFEADRYRLRLFRYAKAIGDHAERTDDRREDVIPQKIEQLPHAALISAAPVFARYTIASSEEGVIGPSARLRREGDAERALALLFLLLGRRAGCGAAAHAAEIGADHQRAVRAEADFSGTVTIPRRLARGLGRIGEMHLTSARRRVGKGWVRRWRTPWARGHVRQIINIS